MKSNTPLVTCFVITYNHAHTVRRALDSILNQKTEFPFKIRIGDDCSTDGTTEICADYAKRHPGIIEFTPRARNIGCIENGFDTISRIDTEFMSGLDGDDYWCDDLRLQKMVNALQANPDCSFCGHNTLQIDSAGREKLLFTTRNRNIRKKYVFPKRYNKREMVKVHPSSRLCRTSCLDLENLKYKESICWDSSSYWYFLSKGNLLYINEAMSVYNYNGEGAFSGSTKTRQRYMSMLNTMNINEELDFRYNHIFMHRLLKRRYRKLMNLSLWDQAIFRYNPARRLDRYHEVKQSIEKQLSSEQPDRQEENG